MSIEKKCNIANWILGNIICTLGIALLTKSDFGLSTISALPYIIHVWLRDTFVWFTQGTSEYIVEALVLAIGCIIIKKFKLSYLLAFAEAVFVGFIIDGWFLIFAGNGPYETLPMRIIAFIIGMLACGLGVAFYFRTTWPVQTYDIVVMKIIETYNLPQKKVKQINDLIYLALDLILSITLIHSLKGIGFATIVIAFANATIIDTWGKYIDKVENKLKESL